MVKREFQAQIISDDFSEAWLRATAKHEGFSLASAVAYYGSAELYALSDRISGAIVTITHNTYVLGADDYFEKIDNNFVMHEELFIELD